MTRFVYGSSYCTYKVQHLFCIQIYYISYPNNICVLSFLQGSFTETWCEYLHKKLVPHDVCRKCNCSSVKFEPESIRERNSLQSVFTRSHVVVMTVLPFFRCPWLFRLVFTAATEDEFALGLERMRQFSAAPPQWTPYFKRSDLCDAAMNGYDSYLHWPKAVP